MTTGVIVGRPQGHDVGDDHNLTQKLKAGDADSFELIVKRLQNSLLAVARAITKNPATAEEIVQDTWLAVIENIGTFQERASLKNWIFAILTNKAKTRLKRDSRILALIDPEEFDTNEPAVSPDQFTSGGSWAVVPTPWDEMTPERIVLGREMWVHMMVAVEALPPTQKAVLLMLEDAGVDQEEAARLLGISLGHLRVLLHRARSKLRAQVAALVADE